MTTAPTTKQNSRAMKASPSPPVACAPSCLLTSHADAALPTASCAPPARPSPPGQLEVLATTNLVPYYQPRASLEMFRRSIERLDVATGIQMAIADFGSKGSPNSTRTEPFVP
ncbi:hypothetical protein BC567DRAFT_239593, partial [Phyllosticta citribraziliensis]